MTRARYGCSTQLAALTLIATVLIAVVALAGCAPPTGDVHEAGGGEVTSSWVQVPDGRSVLCVFWAARGLQAGGVDCDWATAALEGEAP